MANSDEEAQRASFSSLPFALQHTILHRLPVDARARCECVCRSWRTQLADVSLWTRLDLSRSSGVRVRVTDAVMCGASGFARGALTALDVSGCWHITHGALLAMVAAKAGTLTELRVCNGVRRELNYTEAEALLRAAPRLCVLDADVRCCAGEKLLSMLRREPPFGPLRVRRLTAFCHHVAPDEREAAVIALAGGVAAHNSLSSLLLHGAPLNVPDVLDAVVDAVLLRRVRSVQLNACGLSPTSAPVLARLLQESALTELRIWNDGAQLLDAPAAALLADALRTNSTLTSLVLENVDFWRDMAAATALLGALTGHSSLRKLDVYGNAVGAHGPVAGAALGALVAANPPALHAQHTYGCHLGDDGLGHVVDALPANTHLRTLSISKNRMSEAFARERLLPAVRANSGLRKLFMPKRGVAALEAEALVAERAL
jgi:hypothetical protein